MTLSYGKINADVRLNVFVKQQDVRILLTDRPNKWNLCCLHAALMRRNRQNMRRSQHKYFMMRGYKKRTKEDKEPDRLPGNNPKQYFRQCFFAAIATGCESPCMNKKSIAESSFALQIFW